MIPTIIKAVCSNIKREDINLFFKKLSIIPSWLKNLLIFVVIAGALYFGYTKFSQALNLGALLQDITQLNKKVEKVISIQDYNVDLEYIITTMYLMEEMNDLVYQILMLDKNILLEHLEEKAPDDRNIPLIKGRIERIEYQHSILKEHMHELIHKVDPKVKEKVESSK